MFDVSKRMFHDLLNLDDTEYFHDEDVHDKYLLRLCLCRHPHEIDLVLQSAFRDEQLTRHCFYRLVKVAEGVFDEFLPLEEDEAELLEEECEV